MRTGKPLSLIMIAGLIPALPGCEGNYPDASGCPPGQSYYAVCTHSDHRLKGWFGPCRTHAHEAEQDAAAHAAQAHDGKDRWTGIRKAQP